jgi:hypothetical protein
VFMRFHHCSLSWSSWIQSTSSHPVSLISILILSSHLLLVIPSGLFPSGIRPSRGLSVAFRNVLGRCLPHAKLQAGELPPCQLSASACLVYLAATLHIERPFPSIRSPRTFHAVLNTSHYFAANCICLF